jgi:hypothetical protein
VLDQLLQFPGLRLAARHVSVRRFATLQLSHAIAKSSIKALRRLLLGIVLEQPLAMQYLKFCIKVCTRHFYNTWTLAQGVEFRISTTGGAGCRFEPPGRPGRLQHWGGGADA